MNLILQIDSHADLCLNLHTFIYGFDLSLYIYVYIKLFGLH